MCLNSCKIFTSIVGIKVVWTRRNHLKMTSWTSHCTLSNNILVQCNNYTNLDRSLVFISLMSALKQSFNKKRLFCLSWKNAYRNWILFVGNTFILTRTIHVLLYRVYWKGIKEDFQLRLIASQLQEKPEHEVYRH